MKESEKLFREFQEGRSGIEAELSDALEQIWKISKEFGLDPYTTTFELIPADVMHEIGSYGMPGRFSHWTHGRAYRQLKTMYDYGLSRIYEVVINTNPAQAFLLKNNLPIENKFVMAHVMGHSDFFKNNYLFVPTRKDMSGGVILHAERIKKYEEDVGKLAVEKFLDSALTIIEHIDPYKPDRLSKEEQIKKWEEEFKINKVKKPPREQFDNILSWGKPKEQTSQVPEKLKTPPDPDKDVLGFIRDYAYRLEDWQRDILDIVRTESLYFRPQMRTKIMNEGWASFWHKRIMEEMIDNDFITPKEMEIVWDRHSSVVRPDKFNLSPYFLGMKLFEYIEDYYNGNLTVNEKKWLEKNDLPVYPTFEGDIKDSPGRAEIFEVRKNEEDQTFIRNYFDGNFVRRLNLYLYERIEWNNIETIYRIKDIDWKPIRDNLVNSLTNCGYPYIVVEDGNYQNHQELYLKHHFEGQELDEEYIKKTIPHIHALWGRKVHLETVDDKGKAVYTYNGKEIVKK